MTWSQIKDYGRCVESFMTIAASYSCIFMIDKTTTIEDLVSQIPEAVRYMMRQGIKCIACGEPIWGTLELVAREKGFSDEQIEIFVKELNELKTNPEAFQ